MIIILSVVLIKYNSNNVAESLLNEKIKLKSMMDLEKLSLQDFVTVAGDNIYTAEIKNQNLNLSSYSLENNNVQSANINSPQDLNSAETLIEVSKGNVFIFNKEKYSVLVVDDNKDIQLIELENKETIVNSEIKNIGLVILNDYFYLFNKSEQKIYCYNKQGQLITQVKVPTGRKILKSNKNLYVLTATELIKFNSDLNKLESQSINKEKMTGYLQYAICQDLLIALNEKELMITDFNKYYRIPVSGKLGKGLEDLVIGDLDREKLQLLNFDDELGLVNRSNNRIYQFSVDKLNKSVMLIKDPRLEKEVREKIGKSQGKIKPADVENIKQLDLNVSDLVSIKGLEHFISLKILNIHYAHSLESIMPLRELHNLRELYLPFSNIQNLHPLAKLKQLEVLDLKRNYPEDLEPLSQLSNLKELDLNANNIKSIDSLKNLSQLEKLDLSQNQIKNIEALGKLKELQQLNLWGNKIEDISSLSKLTRLQELQLQGNEIKDIKALKDLKELDKLIISRNPIEDITPLKNLTNLKIIDLPEIKTADLKVLSNLKSLEKLKIEVNGTMSLTYLANLKQLKKLSLKVKGTVNLDQLKELEQLEQFNIRSTERIEDINLISNLEQLETLSLSGGVDNIAPVSNLKRLTNFAADRSQIEDISPLANLEKLEEVSLEGNYIDNITPLSKLNNLNTLNLSENKIKEIKSLNGLNKLETLDLSSNKIETLPQNLRLESLKQLNLFNNKLKDINPLLQLPNLEKVELRENPLELSKGSEAYKVIKELEKKGVRVFYKRKIHANSKKGEKNET